MKRIFAVLLLVSIVLSLAACGASKTSISNVTGNTTKKQMEAMIEGETSQNSYGNYSLANGGTFLGVSVTSLLYGFKSDGTLSFVEFDGIYADANKDLVDKMLLDLSKQYGSPDIDKGTSYIIYSWGENQLRIVEAKKYFDVGLYF